MRVCPVPSVSMRQTFLQDAICIHLCPTPPPLSSVCIFCYISILNFLHFVLHSTLAIWQFPCMPLLSQHPPHLICRILQRVSISNMSLSMWCINYDCRSIFFRLCVCLFLSICVFMCIFVRGLGGSGQVIHPSTSPCA